MTSDHEIEAAAGVTTEHATLASLLAPRSVTMSQLYDDYGSVLQLVRRLIGVVPNCDPYLEIWPIGFRTYNLMVPNFLNLPALLVGGGAPKKIVGLAMYTASRTAGCAYCSAHTCSFAIRRGTAADKVAQSFGAPAGAGTVSYSVAEQMAIDLGERLSTVPASFTAADRAALEQQFSPGRAEWLALSVAMMGFLNKFMDAAGIPLEDSAVAETGRVIEPSGWSPVRHLDHEVATGSPPRADSFGQTLGVLRFGPSAELLDRRWRAGAPSAWPAAGLYLSDRTGHDFPVLGRLRHARARRALTAILRDNLSAVDSKLGLPTKALAGLAYAIVAEDEALAGEARVLAGAAGVGAEIVAGVESFARSGGDQLKSLASLDSAAVVALELARACSFSPAQVDTVLIQRAGAALEAPAIVELLVWLSVQQLLHRLSVYLMAA